MKEPIVRFRRAARCLALATIAAFALASQTNAQEYTLSVTLAGPQNIYRGYCPQNETSFTITSSEAVDENVTVVFYLGGNNTAFTDTDPCDAQGPHDFTILTPGVSTVPVPNTYSIVLPAGHTSVTVTVEAASTAWTGQGDCGGNYQTLLCSIPSGTQYTGGQYLVSQTAGIAYAYEYPLVPAITVSANPGSFPPTMTKGTSETISFTITASSAPPINMLVTVLVGGDGTAFTCTDPCYAVYDTDFSLSGLSKAPFPNGFYFYLSAGQTTKTFTVSPLGSGCDCDSGYQTLLVTVPSPPSCSGYTPSPTGYQASGTIYPGN
jgi:hypothetical protein